MSLSIYQKAKKIQNQINKIPTLSKIELEIERNRIIDDLKNKLPEGFKRKENEPCQKSQYQFNVIL